MHHKTLVFLLGFMTISSTAFGQYEHCNALLEHGINDITRTKSANHASAFNYNKYCKSSSSEMTDSEAASAKASIFGVGRGNASANSASSRREVEQWCKENESRYANSEDLFLEARQVSAPALAAWNSCQEAADKRVLISLKNQSELDEFLHFSVDSTNDGDVVMTSVLQKGYRCQVSSRRVNEKGSATEKVKVKTTNEGYENLLLAEQIVIQNGNINVDCQRVPPVETSLPGIVRLKYESGSVVINTSGPKFAIDIPAMVDDFLATPPGAVLAFKSSSCPAGWTVFSQLAGRTIVGVGKATGLAERTLMQEGGEEAHQLTIAEMPAHNHGGVWGGKEELAGMRNDYRYHTSGHEQVKTEGGGQPHNNMPPFLALLYCIKN